MQIKNHVATLLGSFVVVIATGCVSLKAVRSFAESSSATLAGTGSVAQDYRESCYRTNGYQQLASGPAEPCQTEKQASKVIVDIAEILDAYTQSLSALADDDLADYDKNLDALAGEVKNLGPRTVGLTDTQTDAVANLLKVVSKAATSAYQQRQVSMFIVESNSSFARVTTALADIVEKDYSAKLKLEDDAARAVYAEMGKYYNTEPVALQLYSTQSWLAKRELENKLQASQTLARSIRKMAETHDNLAKNAERLDGKETAAFVRTFVAQARPALSDLRTAFRK